MNNEIGRKLTSFTLMAIMVAGGMTIAFPGFAPEASANNANLFVSAENSTFENTFSGAQVIEVVVNDAAINDTDEAKGEPDVTVNGSILRMVQAVDGNWYGYFADKNMADIADATSQRAGVGLDFGTIVEHSADRASIVGVSLSDTDGVAVPPNMNVLREAKDINDNVPGSDTLGQIGVNSGMWPFIQLYEFNPSGNVVVQYNKGGGAQMTTLVFDEADDYASLVMDRATYPTGSQLHATITDTWLNIDPTDEDTWTYDTVNGLPNYQVFDENGASVGDILTNTQTDTGANTPYNLLHDSLGDLMCNCDLILDPDAQGKGTVVTLQDNDNSMIESTSDESNPASWRTAGGNMLGLQPVTITEDGPSSGVFVLYDDSDNSQLVITDDAERKTSATIGYDDSPMTVLVGFEFATIDISPVDDTWNSGETIDLVLVDGDANKNSRVDETFAVSDPETDLIPTIKTGNPFTLANSDNAVLAMFQNPNADMMLPRLNSFGADISVQSFSDRAVIEPTRAGDANSIIIDLGATVGDLLESVNTDDNFYGYNFYNQDVSSFGSDSYDVWILISQGTPLALLPPNPSNPVSIVYAVQIAEGIDGSSGLVPIDDAIMSSMLTDGSHDNWNIGLAIVGESTLIPSTASFPIVADFFSYGFINSGELGSERVANQIIRIEVEESDDNTGTFEGTLEYIMVNQLNIYDMDTYTGLDTISDEVTFVAIEDLTDEDSIRVNYLDLGSDGVSTQIADQEEAPSHSGVVSLDSDTYKVADTVTITLEDADLNVDSELIDIFTINDLDDTIGQKVTYMDEEGMEMNLDLNTGNLGRVLDVTFDDALWTAPVENTCFDIDGQPLEDVADAGLAATGFTLVETGVDSGIFVGDFQIPAYWCRDGATTIESTTGLDIEVNYVDFRDASGEIIEVGDSAGIRANTGSVSLDRSVYPVPFGVPSDFSPSNSSSADNRSVFPLHAGAGGGFLTNGDLTIHVRVNDADFDISASGEDVIAMDNEKGVGPVKVSVIRGASTVVLTTAGGTSASDGYITVGEAAIDGTTPEYGPITEIAPDAGIFEADIGIRYTDGPASDQCPISSADTINDRFTEPGRYCILQGDILQVEYTDPTDASGDSNSVTDSATFDLRNGIFQSDKSVYLIGSDIILTLIEPDFDLDNDQAETYSLDLLEWDSDAATTSMGSRGSSDGAFDPEPSDFRETGDSTGVFQVVVEMPSEINGDRLERGEEIEIEYTDWGPSGSDYVGDEDEDIVLTIYTSNFGATVELDQKVYTWTDKVYITIVAPDHNFDSDLVDEIGNSDLDAIKVTTRQADLDNYKLVETGTDTGIFTGEVILTGFTHNADGDTTTGSNGNDVVSRQPEGSGPTNGLLPASDDDGLTVSFEFSEDETVVGSAIIRWNIGEVQWLESSYPATGQGVVRVIDPDMNLNPEAVDNFTVDVWSESDSGGIDLTVTETNEATGIFEGTVFLTVSDPSSGHRLRVAEGDTITTEYEDNTLPEPYSTADELQITATSIIGTIVPPLERAPASNLRVVDTLNNSLDTVSVDQQVQVAADLMNGQDKEQPFAYLMQVQDESGVTVKLDWISGSLTANQSLTAANSWTPTEAGTYTATVFVWESVETPIALSPPLETTITVN